MFALYEHPSLSYSKNEWGDWMLVKPPKLQRGDTVGIIAPASPPNRHDLQQGIVYLEKLGLRVKVGQNVDKEYGYLAGNDDERVADIHSMFADQEIKAIFSARGGYGTGRIADKIDYQLIQQNPKIFWGYSDLTFLHTAIRQNSNLVTFHGPMVASEMGKISWDSLSDQFVQQLFNTDSIVYDERIAPIETPITGYCKGRIVGGNLCLLATTIGTAFEIDTKDKILLIEDIHEEPRAIDRLLNQLLMTGKLSELKGLIIGDFPECNPSNRQGTLSLEEVLQHYVTIINKPTLKGIKIGHCSPHVSIPLGTMAILDASRKTLTIESGVSDCQC